MHTPGVVGVDENILRVQHDKHVVIVERTVAGPQKFIHHQPLRPKPLKRAYGQRTKTHARACMHTGRGRDYVIRGGQHCHEGSRRVMQRTGTRKAAMATRYVRASAKSSLAMRSLDTW